MSGTLGKNNVMKRALWLIENTQPGSLDPAVELGILARDLLPAYEAALDKTEKALEQADIQLGIKHARIEARDVRIGRLESWLRWCVSKMDRGDGVLEYTGDENDLATESEIMKYLATLNSGTSEERNGD